MSYAMILPEFLKTTYEYSIGLFRTNEANEDLPPLEMTMMKTNIAFENSVEAGPFVKFERVTWEDSPTWKGSVLLITKPDEFPPFLTLNNTKIAAEQVIEIQNRGVWRYPLETTLNEYSKDLQYTLGGREYRCFIPGRCGPWINGFVATGAAKEEDEEDVDGFFGDIYSDRTALHVIQIASLHFEELLKIEGVREWVSEKSSEIQATQLISDHTKQQILGVFLTKYCGFFTRNIGKVTPYVALSNGTSVVDSIKNGNLRIQPFAQEIQNIEMLFRNIFFHHSSVSTNVKEPSQPYTLHCFNEMYWLSLDMHIARTNDKWMLNRTWKALFQELAQCTGSEAKHLIININIPLVCESEEAVSSEDDHTVLSYINPLSYLPKKTCLYQWQLENFFQFLQDFQNKKSVNVTIISHSHKKQQLYIFRLQKEGEEPKETISSVVPFSEKLELVNKDPVTNTQQLMIDFTLLDEVEITDGYQLHLIVSDPESMSFDHLIYKEQEGWGNRLPNFPFSM
jgi:hypothetical protein